MRGTENRLSQFITQSSYYNNPYQIIGHLVNAIERLEMRVSQLERESNVSVVNETVGNKQDTYCPVKCSQGYKVGFIDGVGIKICDFCEKVIGQIE